MHQNGKIQVDRHHSGKMFNLISYLLNMVETQIKPDFICLQTHRIHFSTLLRDSIWKIQNCRHQGQNPIWPPSRAKSKIAAKIQDEMY